MDRTRESNNCPKYHWTESQKKFCLPMNKLKDFSMHKAQSVSKMMPLEFSLRRKLSRNLVEQSFPRKGGAGQSSFILCSCTSSNYWCSLTLYSGQPVRVRSVYPKNRKAVSLEVWQIKQGATWRRSARMFTPNTRDSASMNSELSPM